MLKLYCKIGTCSLAPHIALREVGIPFELKKVNKDKKVEGGGDFLAINAKGYVPALALDDGRVLTENSAVLQYIADLKPEKNLAPAKDSFERYQLQEWLNFITSELHKQFGVLFTPQTVPDTKQHATEALTKRLQWTQHALGSKTFLMGDAFTVADCYFYVILRWTAAIKMSLDPYPGLFKYMERVAGRAAVKEALLAEGLK
jgi:glutathione S-transferase